MKNYGEMKSKELGSGNSTDPSSDSVAVKAEKSDEEPVAREIVVCNSDEEIEEEGELGVSNGFLKVKANRKSRERPNPSKRHLLTNSLLRGLLPSESDKWYSHVSNFPVVKRCCIEHCYFARSRGGTSRYNLRNLPATEENTLHFQNENRVEQQTIDFERGGAAAAPRRRELISDLLANESFDEGISPLKKKKTRVFQGIRSSCYGDNDGDSIVDDSNNKDYRAGENSTGTYGENVSGASGSDESGGDVIIKQLWKNSGSNLNRSDLKVVKNVFEFGESKKSNRPNQKSVKSSNQSIVKNQIPRNFVSVHDLITKIKKMQKLVGAKYEKNFVENSEKIPPPKLKKMIGRAGKEEEFSKTTDYFFPMPNLTKMSASNKNWRVDYMDEDVQSLGLDDLLLKASELNAENFTKALGRKLDSAKSNFNESDGSGEIILTIPKMKRNSADSKETGENGEIEFPKRSNSRGSRKSDFSNSFFESEGKNDAEATQNGSKVSGEEPSPKKPGIKVKTVENINEEFKDSLEMKKRVFKDADQATIPDTAVLEGRKDLFVARSLSPMKDQILQKREKQRNAQEESASYEEEDSRPFIMTIVQGKTEKQRPAILRNSSYFKKKTAALTEGYKSSEKVGGPGGCDRGWEERESNLKILGGSSENGAVEGSVAEAKNSNFKNLDQNDLNCLAGETHGSQPGLYSKVLGDSENEVASAGGETVGKARFSLKKRNIPFILNHNRKTRESSDLSVQAGPTGPPNSGRQASAPGAGAPSKLVKTNEGTEKVLSSEKMFKVTSIEQKLGPKEANRRFIKVVPYEPASKLAKTTESVGPEEPQQKNSDEEFGREATKGGGHLLSLTAFSTILKEILPDKWFLCLDKKYGLQIIKTQIDEVLNPSIMISMVISRCGKLTVNVRGKQLEKSHQLFSNLCDIGNHENKMSLNYILAILNKLRYLSVCFGCDPSLKKYLSEDATTSVECQTQFQQVYRSHLCHLLVSLGKKRCNPCYRMNESLKKRCRRDKLEKKLQEIESAGKDSGGRKAEEEREMESAGNDKAGIQPATSRGVKRNLEDFLEESFLTMKQQIVDEIEKNKKLGEKENALKAQEEVLSFMGLARKENLGIPAVRKSKRKKNSFYKSQHPPPVVKKKIDQKELEFLEKYWTDINTLFSTSLLFGAYSRTGRSRLREKCRMFHKLLSTWKEIVKSNPEWIGGEIFPPDELTVTEDAREKSSNLDADQFEKMDVTTLRAYIINSVKEVNRIKHKLRTRNSYFKILYNKFVKRRMKRPNGRNGKSLDSSSAATTPEKREATSSGNNSRTNTPTDFSSDDSRDSRDKEKTTDEENPFPANGPEAEAAAAAATSDSAAPEAPEKV